MPALRLSGQIYHNIGPIQNEINDKPQFLQCFFYDNTEIDDCFTDEEWKVYNKMMCEIREHNSFLKSIKTHVEQFESEDNAQRIPLYRLIISDTPPPQAPTRTYNKPLCTEVAAIVAGADSDVQFNYDRIVTIQSRGGGIRRIEDTHSSYDPLAYVCTHVKGDKGWTYDIPRSRGGGYVTPMEYYSYRAQVRDDISTNEIEHDALLFGGLLAQQYWCDQWIKVENQRLKWIKFNQKQLKCELYQGLADAVRANDTKSVGSYTVLPSSHIGSKRHQYQSYQDAMALAREFGKSDYFITITCNPEWPEIVEACRGEPSWKRPDIQNRVFHMKLRELLDDLLNKQVLGRVASYVWVIEFQKRGLPHSHLLITMVEQDKPKNADDYDKVVCAEIPNPDSYSQLYSIVTKHMIHGPCGKEYNPHCPCIEKDTGLCTKNFPKKFCDETKDEEDSYPEYRRRSPEKGGYTYTRLDHSGNPICIIDN